MAITETLRPTGQEVLQVPVLGVMTPLGEMIYYPEGRTALSPLVGEPTQLTRTQGIIFEALMTKPESTVTYEELAMTIWNVQKPNPIDIHRMHIYVSRLRVILGDKPILRSHHTNFQLIHTVPNVGCSLTDPAQGWERFRSKEIISCETPAGQIRYRLPERTVFSPVLGREVQLSPLQSALLKKLISEPDIVHTYGEILKEVWNTVQCSQGEIVLIQNVIKGLRKRIGDDGQNPRLIYTRPGVGLSLTPIDNHK